MLFPWPGWGQRFAGLFAVIGDLVSGWLVRHPQTIRWAAEGPLDSWNALVTISHANGMGQQILWDLRRTSYLPLAAFLALALSFPMRLERRIAMLALGCALLQVLPFLRLGALLSSEGPARLIDLSDATATALTIAARVFVLPPGMAFAVPAMLWVLLYYLLQPRAALQLVTGRAPPVESRLPSAHGAVPGRRGGAVSEPRASAARTPARKRARSKKPKVSRKNR